MKKLFITVVILFLAACTHVISKSIREQARVDIPFAAIKENPDRYKGSIFILGGIIASTRNTDEGSIIEVVQTPVDSFGNITDPDTSAGRFLALYKGYLDPLIYKRGREITIAGELIGSRIKKIGEIEYKYPLLEIREIHLWKEKKEYYYYYSPYYYPPYTYRYPYWWYDPWWYWPYYPPPPP